MGYYTDYEIQMENEPIGLLSYLSKEDMLESYLFAALTGQGSEMKWYEHEEDLRKFSKDFPATLFRLDGRGEDGEVWIKYFKDGKMQKCPGRVVYDEFNEKELR